MTSRLIDVLPVTLGSYLVLLGAVLLLDTMGVVPLGGWAIAGAALGLALMALGILSVLAAMRVRRFSRRLRRAVGHVQGGAGLRVQDGVVSTVVGDITLDLATAGLPEGETELTLLCWLGSITVIVPLEAGIDVTAQALVGAVRVLDRREEGVVQDIHAVSEGYATRPRRLRMRLSTLVGEVAVVTPNRAG